MLKLLSRLFVRDKFPYFPQLDAMDCGPACLQMVAKHYGKSVSMGQLRQYSAYSKKGVSLKGISVAAEQLGFKTLGAKVSVSQLKKAPLPLILYWQQYHFVVLYQIKNGRFYVADPAKGKLRLKEDEFLGYWANDRTDNEPKGIALLLEPRPGFNQQEFGDLPGEKSGASTKGLSYILSFLSPYRKYLFQLTLGLSVASLLLLSLPFLTQSIVDIGIGTGNISFVNLILIAQLAIIVSRTGIDFFRTWTLLNIGARINISIISDFLIRLMRLPISFFQTKIIGDLLQRVEDQARIERFLTNSVVNIIFSIITIFTFSFVLFYYSTRIFGVFLLGSIIYVGWILIFLRRRRTLDNELFNSMSINQNHLVQLMTGMQEIKLHNAERTMRWD
ncbi:MAG: cysteine peptidase family C39 domain-containing protein, partial [Bacteroidota bacterium]